METEGMALLRRLLDESLRQHAKDLGAGEGLPEIEDIYSFQRMADVHEYVSTEHTFSPEEVKALLEFADPLDVLAGCWEIRPSHDAFDICGLIDASDSRSSYPLAVDRWEPPQSVRAQLREGREESRRQAEQGAAARPGKTERPGKGGESL